MVGEPSTTSGATSSHWTNGIPPLKQPPFVECTYVPTFVSSHILCCRSFFFFFFFFFYEGYTVYVGYKYSNIQQMHNMS